MVATIAVIANRILAGLQFTPVDRVSRLKQLAGYARIVGRNHGGRSRGRGQASASCGYLRNAGIPTDGHSGLVSDIGESCAHGRGERILVSRFYRGNEYLYRLLKELAGTVLNRSRSGSTRRFHGKKRPRLT